MVVFSENCNQLPGSEKIFWSEMLEGEMWRERERCHYIQNIRNFVEKHSEQNVKIERDSWKDNSSLSKYWKYFVCWL